MCSEEGSRTRTGQRKRHRQERKGKERKERKGRKGKERKERKYRAAAALCRPSSPFAHSFHFSFDFLPLLSRFPTFQISLNDSLALLSSSLLTCFLFSPLACFQGLTGIKETQKPETEVEQRVKRTKLQVLPSLLSSIT